MGYFEGVFLLDPFYGSREVAELVDCLCLTVRMNMGTTTVAWTGRVLGGIDEAENGAPGCRHGWRREESGENPGVGDIGTGIFRTSS